MHEIMKMSAWWLDLSEVCASPCRPSNQVVHAGLLRRRAPLAAGAGPLRQCLSKMQLSDLPDELLSQVLGGLVSPEVTPDVSTAVRTLARFACCSSDCRRLTAADALWSRCLTRATRHKQRSHCETLAQGRLCKLSLRQVTADMQRTEPTAADMTERQWRFRFLPAAGGQDIDAPADAIFDRSSHASGTSGLLRLESNSQMPRYPPLPWSLEGAELVISNFPAHRIARNNEDAGWLAWNENVVMWTVDPALHIEAEAMKEHGNARFRAGDYCGALSAYGQAITVMLGGRQLEAHMQILGFLPPISWSRAEGNAWPEHVRYQIPCDAALRCCLAFLQIKFSAT